MGFWAVRPIFYFFSFRALGNETPASPTCTVIKTVESMEIIIGVLVIFVIAIILGKVLKLAFKLVAVVCVILLVLYVTGVLTFL